MNNWSEFFFLVGSSAAGLTGLMFIAVTFGARLITEEKLPYVDAFFTPVSYHFIQVFILCCVALIPTTHPELLGAMILLSTLWRLTQLRQTHRMMRKAAGESADVDRSDWMLGLILPSAVYLAFLASGICYLTGAAAATPLLAFSLLALLVVALRRAWEMMLWVATKVD